MGDYFPVAPVNDDAKKHNQNLPGMGGVFNYVNLHVYHYAGNNPVKYVDPNGMELGKAGIERLVSDIDESLTTAWNNSFRRSPDVEEWGGAINITPEGRYVAANLRTDGNDRSVHIIFNENSIGCFHSHPYSEKEGGHQGVGFAWGDIFALAVDNCDIMIVEAGTKRFVLEVIDKEKFNINKLDAANYEKTVANYSRRGYSLQDSIIEGIRAMVSDPNSGLRAYQSVDRNKLQFEEIR
jgi:hypothetical protein